MEEIKVKNIIIGKQYQACDNYKKFIQIINNKNINVKVVEAGDRIEIEKEVEIVNKFGYLAQTLYLCRDKM